MPGNASPIAIHASVQPDARNGSAEVPLNLVVERPSSRDSHATTVPASLDLTLVIPARDEQWTIRQLCEQIIANIPTAKSYEILLVDDGSRDATWATILELAREQPKYIRGFRLPVPRGKATALMVGFRASRGQVVLTLDADLQDDPVEIPRFLAELENGFDVISGWKQQRNDPWHKVWASRIFNRLQSQLSGVALHDHNCGYKCYRREVVAQLHLHGDMHRMIPALAVMQGFRVTELAVRHHPRRHGRSKYGLLRLISGSSDLWSMAWLNRFRDRPGHWCHTLAALTCLAAVGALTQGLLNGSVNRCWIAVLLFVQAVTLTTLGVIGEMLVRGSQPCHPATTDGASDTAPLAIQDHAATRLPRDRQPSGTAWGRGRGARGIGQDRTLEQSA